METCFAVLPRNPRLDLGVVGHESTTSTYASRKSTSASCC
jgi:hypothetical protein